MHFYGNTILFPLFYYILKIAPPKKHPLSLIRAASKAEYFTFTIPHAKSSLAHEACRSVPYILLYFLNGAKSQLCHQYLASSRKSLRNVYSNYHEKSLKS